MFLNKSSSSGPLNILFSSFSNFIECVQLLIEFYRMCSMCTTGVNVGNEQEFKQMVCSYFVYTT